MAEKYLKTNIPTLLGCSKPVLRGNHIVVNTYVKRKECSLLNNLTSHLKEPDKEQTKQKKKKE